MVEIGAVVASIALVDALQRIQVGPDAPAPSRPRLLLPGRAISPTVHRADVAIRQGSTSSALPAAISPSSRPGRGCHLGYPQGMSAEQAPRQKSSPRSVDENMSNRRGVHSVERERGKSERTLTPSAAPRLVLPAAGGNSLPFASSCRSTPWGLRRCFLAAPAAYEMIPRATGPSHLLWPDLA